MNKSDLVIATITLARDAAEEALLRTSLPLLAALEIPVFVTDGGSGPEFLEFLHGFPNFNILKAKEKGVYAQAKTSVLAAQVAGASFILYTEPDKRDFFRDFLPAFIAAAPATEKIGVIPASRSAAGFGTFPAFQRTTETTINQCITEITGISGDFTYGPFLFNRVLAPYLNAVTEDIGWGWRPFIFGVAHRLGYTLAPYQANFCCPPEQQQDTPAERIYRMRQLVQNIQGLVLSASVAVKEKNAYCKMPWL